MGACRRAARAQSLIAQVCTSMRLRRVLRCRSVGWGETGNAGQWKRKGSEARGCGKRVVHHTKPPIDATPIDFSLGELQFDVRRDATRIRHGPDGVVLGHVLAFIFRPGDLISGHLLGRLCINHHCDTYPELGEKAFGRAGRNMVTACQWFGYFFVGVVQVAALGSSYVQTFADVPALNSICQASHSRVAVRTRSRDWDSACRLQIDSPSRPTTNSTSTLAEISTTAQTHQ